MFPGADKKTFKTKHLRPENVDNEEVACGTTDANKSYEDADGIVPDLWDERKLFPVRVNEQVVSVVDVGRVRD